VKALDLASQIQTYKDEKANELREQISSERALYVTRSELASAVRELQASIKPLTEYASTTAGRASGADNSRNEYRLNINTVVPVLALLVSVAVIFIFLVVHK
jgi:hypothetical protein